MIARTALACVSLAGVGLATSAPAHAAAACSTTADCIGAIKITQILPVDRAIPTFKFATTVPVKATMTILRNGTVVATRAETSFSTSHMWQYLQGHLQASGYTFHVKAVAQDGSSRGESTTYYTIQRKVTITIDKVLITDDSDYVGAGEIRLFAMAADKDFDMPTTEFSRSSGQSISVGKSLTLYRAKSSVTVKLAARDNDCDYLCYAPPFSDYVTSDGSFETGVGSIKLTMPGLPGYVSDHDFTFKTSGLVKATVFARYTMTAG